MPFVVYVSTLISYTSTLVLIDLINSEAQLPRFLFGSFFDTAFLIRLAYSFLGLVHVTIESNGKTDSSL